MVVVIKRNPEPTLEQHECKSAIFSKKGKEGQNKIKKQDIYGYRHTKSGIFLYTF